MDNRKNNGGKRKGAGRPCKVDEQKLIDKLDKAIDQDEVIKALSKLIIQGDFRALQLYLAYRWGKPQDKIDVTSNGASVNIPVIDFFNNSEE